MKKNLKNNTQAIVYSKKKYPMTDADKNKFEKDIQKERDKYSRDIQCGGIDERGNYTALHYR